MVSLDDRREPILEIFFREFGGAVLALSELDYSPSEEFNVHWTEPETRQHFVNGIPVEQFPIRPNVWIEHEFGMRGVKFDAIVLCLENLGLRRLGSRSL